jgi:hypothetical protein
MNLEGITLFNEIISWREMNLVGGRFLIDLYAIKKF